MTVIRSHGSEKKQCPRGSVPRLKHENTAAETVALSLYYLKENITIGPSRFTIAGIFSSMQPEAFVRERSCVVRNLYGAVRV